MQRAEKLKKHKDNPLLLDIDYYADTGSVTFASYAVGEFHFDLEAHEVALACFGLINAVAKDVHGSLEKGELPQIVKIFEIAAAHCVDEATKEALPCREARDLVVQYAGLKPFYKGFA